MEFSLSFKIKEELLLPLLAAEKSKDDFMRIISSDRPSQYQRDDSSPLEVKTPAPSSPSTQDSRDPCNSESSSSSSPEGAEKSLGINKEEIREYLEGIKTVFAEVSQPTEGDGQPSESGDEERSRMENLMDFMSKSINRIIDLDNDPNQPGKNTASSKLSIAEMTTDVINLLKGVERS